MRIYQININIDCIFWKVSELISWWILEMFTTKFCSIFPLLTVLSKHSLYPCICLCYCSFGFDNLSELYLLINICTYLSRTLNRCSICFKRLMRSSEWVTRSITIPFLSNLWRETWFTHFLTDSLKINISFISQAQCNAHSFMR